MASSRAWGHSLKAGLPFLGCTLFTEVPSSPLVSPTEAASPWVAGLKTHPLDFHLPPVSTAVLCHEKPFKQKWPISRAPLVFLCGALSQELLQGTVFSRGAPVESPHQVQLLLQLSSFSPQKISLQMQWHLIGFKTITNRNENSFLSSLTVRTQAGVD